MNKTEFTTMAYDEFDELVRTHLKSATGYEFVAYEEMVNDTSKTFYGVEPLDMADEYVQKYTLKAFDEGRFEFMAGELLNYLCAKRVIEPGNYIIEVCW